MVHHWFKELRVFFSNIGRFYNRLLHIMIYGGGSNNIDASKLLYRRFQHKKMNNYLVFLDKIKIFIISLFETRLISVFFVSRA